MNSQQKPLLLVNRPNYSSDDLNNMEDVQYDDDIIREEDLR